jgi:flagellar biosynthesis component FlhA
MAKPAIYWGAAAVVAAGVVLMHIGVDAWALARFPELQRPMTDLAPLSRAAKLFMLGYLALSVGGAAGAVALIFLGLSARDQQRWQRERQERQREQEERERQWQRERQERQRLQEIRDQLWLESLPAPDRECILARRRGERELQQRAQAIREAERRGEADGR